MWEESRVPSMPKGFVVLIILACILVAGAAFLFPLPSSAYLDEQLDQAYDEQLTTTGCCNGVQTFTVGITGQLTRVEIGGFVEQGVTETVTLNIIALHSNGMPILSSGVPT